MKELFSEIWASIRRNKLRTFLTGFSVAWGIFMLVILLGSGNGLKHGVGGAFGSMNRNTIQLYPNRTSIAWNGHEKWRRIELSENDVALLRDEFPEVDQIGVNTWLSSSMVYGDDFLKDASIQGASPETADMDGVEMASGRYINHGDMAEVRKVIVLDEEAAGLLFKGLNPVGKRVLVNGNNFTVIGVRKAGMWRGNGQSVIPQSTAQFLFRAGSKSVDRIVFSLKGIDETAELRAFEKRLRARLASVHDFSPEDESAIWLANMMEQYRSTQMVFFGIDLFIWIIALATLLAGIVGVSNIMLVTVQERTFEFGVRKALGARPAQIIRLILVESLLITAIFGYLGLVLGVFVMEGVGTLLAAPSTGQGPMGISFFVDPTLDLSIAVSATVVLVLAGLVAGYVPARRAAHIKTIDALRYNK